MEILVFIHTKENIVFISLLHKYVSTKPVNSNNKLGMTAILQPTLTSVLFTPPVPVPLVKQMYSFGVPMY